NSFNIDSFFSALNFAFLVIEKALQVSDEFSISSVYLEGIIAMKGSQLLFMQTTVKKEINSVVNWGVFESKDQADT
ncbi:MAG: hypothetical protein LKG36_06310, partial [[Lactobacillus] timonensis]|nr:hypothetical protein [[Lactobacillus] timonensis]